MKRLFVALAFVAAAMSGSAAPVRPWDNVMVFDGKLAVTCGDVALDGTGYIRKDALKNVLVIVPDSHAFLIEVGKGAYDVDQASVSYGEVGDTIVKTELNGAYTNIVGYRTVITGEVELSVSHLRSVLAGTGKWTGQYGKNSDNLISQTANLVLDGGVLSDEPGYGAFHLCYNQAVSQAITAAAGGDGSASAAVLASYVAKLAGIKDPAQIAAMTLDFMNLIYVCYLVPQDGTLYADGNQFALTDGVNVPDQVFEFDSGYVLTVPNDVGGSAGTKIADGQTFRITGGGMIATFEFNKSGGLVTPAPVLPDVLVGISVSNEDTQESLCTKIVTAVSSLPAASLVTLGLPSPSTPGALPMRVVAGGVQLWGTAGVTTVDVTGAPSMALVGSPGVTPLVPPAFALPVRFSPTTSFTAADVAAELAASINCARAYGTLAVSGSIGAGDPGRVTLTRDSTLQPQVTVTVTPGTVPLTIETGAN
ncbi:MAG TPA: hypothetical protein PLU30_13265 [Verrucomicrobiae bacterium]|nr:hypothetical protein [Verrucomicrobiae bacterium]